MKQLCSSCAFYIEITKEVGMCNALGIVQENGIIILDAINTLIELNKNDNIHTPLLVQSRFGCVCHRDRKNENL